MDKALSISLHKYLFDKTRHAVLIIGEGGADLVAQEVQVGDIVFNVPQIVPEGKLSPIEQIMALHLGLKFPVCGKLGGVALVTQFEIFNELCWAPCTLFIPKYEEVNRVWPNFLNCLSSFLKKNKLYFNIVLCAEDANLIDPLLNSFLDAIIDLRSDAEKIISCYAVGMDKGLMNQMSAMEFVINVLGSVAGRKMIEEKLLYRKGQADRDRIPEIYWQILPEMTGSQRTGYAFSGDIQYPPEEIKSALIELFRDGILKQDYPWEKRANGFATPSIGFQNRLCGAYFSLVYGKSEGWYRGDDFYQALITLVSMEWENLCREFVSGRELSGVTYGEATRWLGTGVNGEEIEINVFSYSEDRKAILVGECLWRENISSQETYNELSKKIANLPLNNQDVRIQPALFMKKPSKVKIDDCLIYSVEDIIQILQ